MPIWLGNILFVLLLVVVGFGILAGLLILLTRKPDHDRDSYEKSVSSMTDSSPFD